MTQGNLNPKLGRPSCKPQKGTSTEHVFNVSAFCRTPYNDIINWRPGKHRILIFDSITDSNVSESTEKLKSDRKSLVKQQILMYQTAVYWLVNGGITHQTQQISEKGDIARQYIDT